MSEKTVTTTMKIDEKDQRDPKTAKLERAAEAKATNDRAELAKIADELAALKPQIRGINEQQSGAIDGLVSRLRALVPPAPAAG